MPAPVVNIANYTSWGPLAQELGIPPNLMGKWFPAHALHSGERVCSLEWRSRYFLCTQHNHKVFNWAGVMIPPVAKHVSQPLIGGAVPNMYVPLDQRRPNNPYRIGKTIVGRFTGLVFGQGRWPNVLSDDPETQDFCEELARAADLHAKMIELRDVGGSCGTAGLSWWFQEGVPRVRVHKGHQIHVQAWEDEDAGVPAHVTELYQFSKTELTEKGAVRVQYWQRRDWTKVADVVFVPERVNANSDPSDWTIDQEKTVQHGDGFCHFVWVRNLPNLENGGSEDGWADYEGVYENMDMLDQLNTVHSTGVVKNLDPTLLLKMHPDEVGEAAVQKGSDNALAVGPNGSAEYLTLGGDVVAAGQSALQGERNKILETTECVIPDPDQLVAAGTSSVALRIVYSPMLNKADLLRTAYGNKGLLRVLEQMLESARSYLPDPTAENPEQRFLHEEKLDEQGNPVVGPDGKPELEAVEYTLALAPRVVMEDVVDAEGNPTGEQIPHEQPRVPGKGRIYLEWPDYFPETPTDRQQKAAALTAATGGKPVLSQQSAVEQWAASTDRSGAEEYARILVEKERELKAQAEAQAGMFQPAGRW